MDNTKIGIIGLGYVGNAIKNSMDYALPFYDIKLLDPPKGIYLSYENLKDCNGIFVCVPSPSKDDGSCDTSILESVLENLNNISYTGVIISKVTAPPGVYKQLQKKYKNLVHSPEFLTAANAEQDYTNAKFVIIGGEVSAYIREAERIIKITQPSVEEVIHCSIEEAALSKYMINSFLATKVVFMNEMEQLSRSLGCDWKNISNAVKLDSRIGSSHMQVPGGDGTYGFGGMCFPKDTQALVNHAKEYNINLEVLESAIKKNLFLRLK